MFLNNSYLYDIIINVLCVNGNYPIGKLYTISKKHNNTTILIILLFLEY